MSPREAGEAVRRADDIRARNAQLADLKARSPMRGRAAQADAAHLPLFIAADEPTLI